MLHSACPHLWFWSLLLHCFRYHLQDNIPMSDVHVQMLPHDCHNRHQTVHRILRKLRYLLPYIRHHSLPPLFPLEQTDWKHLLLRCDWLLDMLHWQLVLRSKYHSRLDNYNIRLLQPVPKILQLLLLLSLSQSH